MLAQQRLFTENYEEAKKTDKDHVATPRYIERTFKLVDENKIKAFALLLPLSTLETATRANMYELYQDKLSIIIFKKRIKFLGHTQVFNKACCWICYNIKALENKKIGWI